MILRVWRMASSGVVHAIASATITTSTTWRILSTASSILLSIVIATSASWSSPEAGLLIGTVVLRLRRRRWRRRRREGEWLRHLGQVLPL